MADRGLVGLVVGAGIGAAVCYYLVSKERAKSEARLQKLGDSTRLVVLPL